MRRDGKKTAKEAPAEAPKEERVVRRFERRLPHAPEKVWRALTDARELAHWFPANVEGERRERAPLRFHFPDGETEPVAGEIIAWDPPRLLAYTMGDETLRWELSPVPEGCRLVFETSYPASLGEDANDNGIVAPPRAHAVHLAA
ncbi:MAG TPA: SRPBCC domain-containing protein [Polyangiaceae bacterium]|nr:SRPBCC domain-containing protein [Polyangiaceae bacterium]